MTNTSSIEYVDSAPLAASIYCQLYSEVCNVIGQCMQISEPISKIWLLEIKGCIFSIVCNNDDAPPGITILQDFDELSAEVSLPCYSRMLHFNFSNGAATGILKGAMFAVDPIMQCAVLVQKIPLDQLCGEGLVGILEELADFAEDFRASSHLPSPAEQIPSTTWDAENIALALGQMLDNPGSKTLKLDQY